MTPLPSATIESKKTVIKKAKIKAVRMQIKPTPALAEQNVRYRIQGGVPLRGDITVSGSKNATLPLIAGCILAEGETMLANVPRVRDVDVMIKILEFLGARITRTEAGRTLHIRTDRMENKPLPRELVSMLRGSIVLLGPLLARFGWVQMAYPGGDVIGKRPVRAHIEALTQLGAQDVSTENMLHLKGMLRAARIILPEFSVTATENALFAAALLPGETVIELAAAEPHVQDCAKLVQAMGAEVDGAGTHTLKIRGNKSLKAVKHAVTPDYLEAGSFIIAALVTRGRVRLHGIEPDHLLSFLDAIRRMGGVWRYDESEKTLFVDGEISSLNSMEIRTNIHPGFHTDLLAPMGVAMTQAKGVSRIFERLYEGRMAYLYELEKMGAHIEVLNSHQALIIGPTQLKGRLVASNDIRAGAAMVLAGLCASGETIVTDVRYIERGYDSLECKLNSLGAKIVREVE